MLGDVLEVLLDVGQVARLDRGRRQQRDVREDEVGGRVADAAPPRREHGCVRLRDRDGDADACRPVAHAPRTGGRKPDPVVGLGQGRRGDRAGPLGAHGQDAVELGRVGEQFAWCGLANGSANATTASATAALSAP